MKKIYQIIMLCAIGFALVSCGGNGSNSTTSRHGSEESVENHEVDEFLEKYEGIPLSCYQEEDIEAYARKAVMSGDFEAAHKCLARLKSEDNFLNHDDLEEFTLEISVEEAKYLVANNTDDTMPRIKMKIADFSPKTAKPVIGDDMNSYDPAAKYLEEVEKYNAFLSKVVDYLVSVDMIDEAKQIAGKGLERPVEKSYKVDSFSDADAQAIADKVKE